MINMVEHCDGNRQQLIETEVSSSYDAADSGSEETTAIEAMIQVGLQGINWPTFQKHFPALKLTWIKPTFFNAWIRYLVLNFNEYLKF